MPKNHRNKEITRQKILNTAFWLIYNSSFNAVSFDKITKATNLTKGALYHYFPTKNDLGYAVVDEVLKPITIQKWVEPLKKHENALDGILECVKTHMIQSPAEYIPLGCPLNNLIQEVANTDPIFKKKLSEVLDLWINGIAFYLKQSQKRGLINKKVNTKNLAKFIVLSQEGAFGVTKCYNNPDAFKILYTSLRDYFKSISKIQ